MADDAPLQPDAEEVLALVVQGAEAFAKKAADGLYDHLLAATQDYLIDNARFNIGERVASAERQARHDREERGKVAATANAIAYAAQELVGRDCTYDGANVIIPCADHAEAIRLVAQLRLTIAVVRERL